MQQASTWLAAGRYEVGEVVGRGGYGMVCRGFDRKTRTAVALKMLTPEAGRDPDVVERMLREQQALVALSGTCAVTAIDLCRLESGAPCLVMEWLDGRDLEQQLSVWEAAGQRGSLAQLREIVRALSQTLARAHELELVHRDIKPANVFLVSAPAPAVRLLDFGLSRMRSAAPITAMGMVMGSPSYIAPETWLGNSTALDGRADLYALAVIVFRYLTGNLPFDAPDLIAKMTAVTSGPRPSVVALRPDLPVTMDAWMMRALAVDPEARFQNGSDFLIAFEAALSGHALPAGDETSGVRPIGAGSREAAERASVLTSAFRAASSLLRRFTQPKSTSEVPPPPKEVPSPLEPGAPQTVLSATLKEAVKMAPSDTHSRARDEPSAIWLESCELEALEADGPASDSSPLTLRSELPAAASPSDEPEVNAPGEPAAAVEVGGQPESGSATRPEGDAVPPEQQTKALQARGNRKSRKKKARAGRRRGQAGEGAVSQPEAPQKKPRSARKR